MQEVSSGADWKEKGVLGDGGGGAGVEARSVTAPVSSCREVSHPYDHHYIYPSSLAVISRPEPIDGIFINGASISVPPSKSEFRLHSDYR